MGEESEDVPRGQGKIRRREEEDGFDGVKTSPEAGDPVIVVERKGCKKKIVEVRTRRSRRTEKENELVNPVRLKLAEKLLMALR